MGPALTGRPAWRPPSPQGAVRGGEFCLRRSTGPIFQLMGEAIDCRGHLYGPLRKKKRRQLNRACCFIITESFYFMCIERALLDVFKQSFITYDYCACIKRKISAQQFGQVVLQHLHLQSLTFVGVFRLSVPAVRSHTVW